MGVNIFILDRKPARLAVAGIVRDVGSLRRFWKIIGWTRSEPAAQADGTDMFRLGNNDDLQALLKSAPFSIRLLPLQRV
jgi:hypothetical protein